MSTILHDFIQGKPVSYVAVKNSFAAAYVNSNSFHAGAASEAGEINNQGPSP